MAQLNLFVYRIRNAYHIPQIKGYIITVTPEILYISSDFIIYYFYLYFIIPTTQTIIIFSSVLTSYASIPYRVIYIYPALFLYESGIPTIFDIIYVTFGNPYICKFD